MPTYTRTLNLSTMASSRRPLVVSLLPPSGRITFTFRWNRRAHRKLRSKSADDGAYFFSLADDAGVLRVRSRRVTVCADMLATARAGDTDVPPGSLACVGPRDPQVLDLADGTCTITYSEDYE